MTLTTYDDILCKKIEPNESTTKERFEVLKIMRDNGIPTVVWLSPILPFINDTEENIRGILEYCIEAQVKAILCFGMGLTLREGNREYFFQSLDRLFPGLKEKYMKEYGNKYELQKMMPDFKGKRVLDLGCGFGWHCRYAAQQGAKTVVGVDVSERMLQEAREKTTSSLIEYIHMTIEDIDFRENSFDVVITSLVFHYIKSFEDIVKKINKCLSKSGNFVFSTEHPIFTAQGPQDWYYDNSGNPLHWPVDHYFEEGVRKAVFLGEEVTKYHRTITTYINTLIHCGFEILKLVEPQPADYLIDEPGMKDELRRPMMLLIVARKK